MKYAGKTDIGQKRRNNQDSFAVFTTGNCLCAVVCDGMGGAKGGNVASALAVKTFASNVKKQLSDLDFDGLDANTAGKILKTAVDKANNEVFLKAVGDDELDGMGTTLVSVICSGNTCFAVNIGDSRLYKQSANGEFVQVSNDHSFVKYLVDRGEITPEQAAVHPNKNFILRAVGVNEDVEGDYFIIRDFARLLLCTDGLTNQVTDRFISDTIAPYSPSTGKFTSLKSRVDKLISAANDTGGSDNITAVLIENDPE
ncbi:MAG: Stp1/IreP family PP2C-type Ser/Thr phosphatase [Clostridia bacterium]|nr:Stp1/IreP family PP2C-type Ser/Thr phosphatase [Clostridia bacterium]